MDVKADLVCLENERVIQEIKLKAWNYRSSFRMKVLSLGNMEHPTTGDRFWGPVTLGEWERADLTWAIITINQSIINF